MDCAPTSTATSSITCEPVSTVSWYEMLAALEFESTALASRAGAAGASGAASAPGLENPSRPHPSATTAIAAMRIS
jgi:hypothetical protein